MVKKCNKRFVNRTLTYRMRHSKWIIDKAKKLRKRGLTYRQIANKMISHVTIMRWCIGRKRVGKCQS